MRDGGLVTGIKDDGIQINGVVRDIRIVADELSIVIDVELETFTVTVSPTALSTPDQVAPRGVVQVRNRRTQLNVSEEGVLEMLFAGSARLVARPAPDVEAWQIDCSDGTTVVALPGGGYTWWR